MIRDYKAVFLRGAVRSGTYIIQRRLQTATILSTKDQGQVFHTLTYTLDSDEVWGTARDLILIAAPDMEQAGHRNAWMDRVNKGIKRSHDLKDLTTKAWLHIYLGELYQYQSQYDNARTQFESSIAYFGKENKIEQHARALNSLANVFRSERHFSKAGELVNEALEIAGELKETQLHSSLVRAVIGIDTYDWQKAKYFSERSLALAQEINDQRMEAWSFNNLLLASWGLKEYQLAISYYDRAMRLFNRVTDPIHKAVLEMNVGIVFFTQNKFSQALELYLSIEQVFSQAQDWVRVAMLNNNLGMAYHQLQEWDKAEEAYQISINQWKRLCNIRELVNVMDNLGLLYLAQKFYDLAIQVFSEALNWLDQIKDDPNYDIFFQMVSESLRSAREQKPS